MIMKADRAYLIVNGEKVAAIDPKVITIDEKLSNKMLDHIDNLFWDAILGPFNPPTKRADIHPINMARSLMCIRCKKLVSSVEVDHPNGWQKGPWSVTAHCHGETERFTISKEEIESVMKDVDNAKFTPFLAFKPKLKAGKP